MKNLINYLSKKSLSLGNDSGMTRKWFGNNSGMTRIRLASLICLCMLTVGVGQMWGADATVTLDFEGSGSFPNNASWTCGGSESTSYNHTTSGSKCAVFAVNGTAYITYGSSLTNVKSVTLYGYRTSKNTTHPSFGVEKSTDGGKTWSEVVAPSTLTLSSKDTWYLKTITIPQAKIFTGLVRVKYTCESNAQKFVDDITITYEGSSYTVTATRNNNSYGTVSVSGTTITASPSDCYQVISGTGGYTVTSGTASVSHTGTSNTLTVTPSTDCTIQVNFEKKTVNTYIDEIQDNGEQELCDTHDAPSLDDKTPANSGTCAQQHWHFMGWVTAANKANPTDLNIITAGTSMTANGTTYYAVWSKSSGSAFNGSAGGTFKIYADVSGTPYYMTSTVSSNAVQSTTTEASGRDWTLTKVTVSSVDYFTISYTSGNTTYYLTGPTTNTADMPAISTSAYNWKIAAGTYGSWRLWSASPNSSGKNAYAYRALMMNSSKVYKNYCPSDSYYDVEIGSISYSDYITTCCTNLGTINGSVTLSNADCTPNQLKATWKMNATTGIASQVLHVYKASDDTEITASKITGISASTSNQTQTISGLDPCTAYYVKVENISSGGAFCGDGFAGDKSSNATTNAWGVTEHLTHTTHTTGAATACPGSNYIATYTVESGYVLPSDITLTIGGASKTKDTHYTWSVSGDVGTLTILAANITNSAGAIDITITSTAAAYQFWYGDKGESWTATAFVSVGNNEHQITNFVMPAYEYEEGLGQMHWNVSGSGISSTNREFYAMTFAQTQSQCGDYQYYNDGDNKNSWIRGPAAGAKGTLRIYDNQADNGQCAFIPNEYILKFGSSEIPFVEDGSDANVWETAILSLSTLNGGSWTGSTTYRVGVGDASHNWVEVYNKCAATAVSSMGYKTASGNNWATGLNNISSARGKFRIWINNCTNGNWECHFVPYYRVTYDGSGASGSTTASADKSCEGNDSERTVVAAANGFTVPTGKSFGGWASSPENAAAGTVAYAAGADVVLTQSIVLYAIWTDIDYTVTVNQNPNVSATTTGQTSSAHYNGTINLTTTVPSGYRFVNWTTSDGFSITNSTSATTASFTMPAKNVTVTANFQQTHTVTWLSNGENYVSPVVYDHGAELALPAGTPSAPGGCSDKVFVGWTSDSEISTETSTKPTIISAGGAVTGGATYRAVFADQVGDPDHFKRVTQLSDITEGGEIVFGFYVTSNTKLCGLDFSGWTTYSCATGVDETSNKIPVPSDANIWTVSKESGYWVFTNKGDGTTKMATSNSSSNNELDPETQTYYKWNIGASSSGTSNFYVQLYNGSSLTNCALELYESTWKIYAPSTGSGGSKTYTYASNAYTALKLYVPAGSEDNYITLCSTCTTPSDVTASGITTDGATITWNGTSQENNGGSGTGFVVKYGTNSTRDANSNTINVAAGTNTADLTGLAQGTKYYVWVQSKCDNSWSTTPAEFTTLVSHTATFIGADGSTLQSSAIVEGESVTYSGSTPVSCDTGDGASTAFVGWATDTWEGKKAAKGNIPVGTTFYDVVGGGESLPNMGNSDVTYYAVFAKATGDPLEENTYTGSFSSKVFSSSNSTSATVSGVSWTLDAYHYDNEWNQVFCTDFSTGNNSRGQKVGSSSNWPAYMSLTTSGISGTITSVAVSTAGNSGVNATVAVSVGSSGWKLKNTNNYSASLTNSNTAYEFTGSGTGSISIDWAEEEENYTDALYFSQIVVAYTTGGDISYSNYMTTCSQCVTPNSVTADAITEAGATINWAGTSKTGTTGFTVLWGTDGTRANNSNSANVDADTKTYSITGLSAGTTYYVWVQSRCDDSWSDRISFTTKAIHTISFSADNGTISSGATIDIVNGETLTFPSVTSTTCGTFVGWTTGDYDNTAAPSPFYTAGAEMADITAPAAYKAVYRTASGAETLVTDNWTGAKTGVTTYATWTKTDASAATYQGYTAKNSTYSNCIQMKSADSNSGIITTASGGDAKKVTITWNSNTTSGRTVDVYGKKAAYSSAADLYSAGTQGTKIGSIVYGTSTELEIDGDYQYIGLRSNSSALYIDNIAIQWYGSPMHYMTSPTCNPMVGITESLSAFTYAYGAGPSASQSFTVSGSNLTNNVTVAAPANYEVCLTAAGTYSSSVSIPQVAGEIDNTTVYVRLKEGLNVGSYNGGVITVSSTGASDATSAALTGSVTKAAATMAFTPDVYEATYEGSPVIVNFMLTLNGDGTVAYSRSPAAGSRTVNTDGENTFTALQAGIWTITATHTPGDNYTKAANATATVRVKCVDTYVDFIHNKAVLTYGSGTPVTDGKMEDWGSGYTVPYVADESEATSGSCQTTHFKFVGWVSEDEINIVEGTFKPGYTLIPAGTAGKTASTKTYYAVWAKLED